MPTFPLLLLLFTNIPYRHLTSLLQKTNVIPPSCPMDMSPLTSLYRPRGTHPIINNPPVNVNVTRALLHHLHIMMHAPHIHHHVISPQVLIRHAAILKNIHQDLELPWPSAHFSLRAQAEILPPRILKILQSSLNHAIPHLQSECQCSISRRFLLLAPVLFCTSTLLNHTHTIAVLAPTSNHTRSQFFSL